MTRKCLHCNCEFPNKYEEHAHVCSGKERMATVNFEALQFVKQYGKQATTEPQKRILHTCGGFLTYQDGKYYCFICDCSVQVDAK
jgi:hypothetical protein